MYKVKFMKYVTNGLLESLTHDSIVSWTSLDLAVEYVAFLLNHTTIPVKSIAGGDYTCHVVRIEKE